MSGEKGETFSILRIYDEPELKRNEPESSDIFSQHEPQAQSQLDRVRGTPRWALQALDRSQLQTSWLSEAEPGEAAEFSPR